MSILCMSCRVVFGALLVGLAASCSPPPAPSAETAALEGSLLTVADVGGSFVVESLGLVGLSGGGICPESSFGFDDVGVVRASFVSTVDGDEVSLIEMLRAVEPGELDGRGRRRGEDQEAGGEPDALERRLGGGGDRQGQPGEEQAQDAAAGNHRQAQGFLRSTSSMGPLRTMVPQRLTVEM